MTETTVLEKIAVKEREAVAVKELEGRMRRFVGMAVSSLLLAAFGLAVSVIFIPAAALLAMIAVVIGVLGLAASYVVPRVVFFSK